MRDSDQGARSRKASRSGGARGGRKRRWLLRLGLAGLLGAVALAVLAAVFHKRVLNSYNRRVADYHVNAAREAAAEGSWELARARARSALIKRPGDPEAGKLWFRSMLELEDPARLRGAIFVLMRLRDEHALVAEALEVIAADAPQPVFLGAFLSLRPEDRKRPEVLSQFCRFLTMRGAFEEAEKILRKEGPAEEAPELMAELVRVLCARPSAERLAEARAVFVKLVEGSDAHPGAALEALRVLASRPGGLEIDGEVPDLEPWISSLPEAEVGDRLRVMQQHLSDSTEAWTKAMDRAVTEFGPQAPAVVGNWLNRRGENERAIKLLEEPARGDEEAFVARIEAFLQAGQAEEAQAALAAPPEGCNPVIHACLKAMAWRLAGDRNAEARSWVDALELSSTLTDRNHFLQIAALARLTGASGFADEAWVRAVKLGRGPLPFYADLKPLIDSLAQKGRSDEVMEMTRVLLRFEPDNLELKNQFCYSALLHELISPANAIEVLEEILAADPERSDAKASLALAHLLNREPGAALKIAETLPEDDSQVSPELRASLLGCARLLAGGANDALPRDLKWSVLMPREAEIFRNLIAESGAEEQVPKQLRNLIAQNKEARLEWEQFLARRADRKADPEAAIELARFLEKLKQRQEEPAPELPKDLFNTPAPPHIEP